MNFANLIENDIVNSENGLCTSLWFNECDIRCSGCHNKDLWDVEHFIDNDIVVEEVMKALTANGVKRSLSILGGEPLSVKNRKDCAEIVQSIREKMPDLFIRLWTGRTFETLKNEKDLYIDTVLKNINCIITGPFQEENKVFNIPLKGSSNQEIHFL